MPGSYAESAFTHFRVSLMFLSFCYYDTIWNENVVAAA